MSQLLLVEDDPEIRRALVRALSELGHAVTSAGAGMPALQHVLDHRPDLVVLDLGLPDVDGTELLRMLRSVSDVPVVIATARDDEAQIVRALDCGADDYIIKPFGAAQLDARIRAVLRRTQSGEPDGAAPSYVVGDLRLDPAAREATLAGVALDLSAREFDVLSFLAARAGTVVSKRDLLTHVWRQPWGGAEKTVDVHLSWIRRKLGETALRPRYLHTVRGVGVKLAAPTSPAS
ncbi:MAG: DNA-binding response regulator [Actinobacteria bacterium 13_2_20CM_2_71_6]|nr:MAG: DNA-binding response regulator [Actinobacteria bacterium 13_2_20CM_2_71_6]